MRQFWGGVSKINSPKHSLVGTPDTKSHRSRLILGTEINKLAKNWPSRVLFILYEICPHEAQLCAVKKSLVLGVEVKQMAF